MSMFLKILFMPYVLFFNVIGGLWCLALVGFTNGYESALEQLKKASEK